MKKYLTPIILVILISILITACSGNDKNDNNVNNASFAVNQGVAANYDPCINPSAQHPASWDNANHSSLNCKITPTETHNKTDNENPANNNQSGGGQQEKPAPNLNKTACSPLEFNQHPDVVIYYNGSSWNYENGKAFGINNPGGWDLKKLGELCSAFLDK